MMFGDFRVFLNIMFEDFRVFLNTMFRTLGFS